MWFTFQPGRPTPDGRPAWPAYGDHLPPFSCRPGKVVVLMGPLRFSLEGLPWRVPCLPTHGLKVPLLVFFKDDAFRHRAYEVGAFVSPTLLFQPVGLLRVYYCRCEPFFTMLEMSLKEAIQP